MRNIFSSIFILLFVFQGKTQDSIQHYTLDFTTSNIKILSDAYLHYGSNFNDILSQFEYDSTLFNERYNDTLYLKTSLRREYSSTSPNDNSPSYQSQEYRNPSATIKKYKIKNDSYWGIHIGKNRTLKDRLKKYSFGEITSFRFSDIIFPDLQSKKELKKYLKKNEICDHRIYFNKKTNIFQLEFKTRNAFIRKDFFPYYSSLEKWTDPQTSNFYYSRFMEYLNAQYKEEEKFNKDLIKQLQRIRRDRMKLIQKKWRNFELMYMSAEERKMGMDQWLQYYNLIIQDEFNAMMNSEPKKNLIDRFLRQMGYRLSKMDMVNQNKTIRFLSDNKSPLIDQVTIINLSQMYFGTNLKYNNYSPFKLNLDEGDEYAFILTLANGDYGVVKGTVESDAVQTFEFKAIPKELVSLDMVSKKSGL